MKVAGRIVTPEGVVDGTVDVDGTRIVAVTPGAPGDAGRRWIVPGFVDIHVHGGGGHTFTTGDADQARAAAEFHLGRGTTTLLASLVSAPYEVMRDAVTAYTPLVDDGTIAGVHFEGPYLSGARCGAQNPAYLRDPSIEELSPLVAGGAVRMVTLAPERPGALEAIRFLDDHGVAVAIGHTDASYDQTMAGIRAGATVGTHVFNGMRPPHHREPGPVYALLGAPEVTCEFVADGVHLHEGTLAFATSVTGPDRAALVTDAISAAGMADGGYDLGGLAVTVADGQARLAGTGSIAGSTLTMDVAFRRAVAAGASVVAASRMASGTPAAAVGLAGSVGALRPGLRADLVELSEDLSVVRVMRAGTWL